MKEQCKYTDQELDALLEEAWPEADRQRQLGELRSILDNVHPVNMDAEWRGGITRTEGIFFWVYARKQLDISMFIKDLLQEHAKGAEPWRSTLEITKLSPEIEESTSYWAQHWKILAHPIESVDERYQMLLSDEAITYTLEERFTRRLSTVTILKEPSQHNQEHTELLHRTRGGLWDKTYSEEHKSFDLYQNLLATTRENDSLWNEVN